MAAGPSRSEDASTAVLMVLQAAVFVAWWLTERTLDVHTIVGRRREAFY